MDDSRFAQLSPRHRDCLRLVYAHQTTKEIARELGNLSPGTVKGYLAEAVRILGARNRREAAIRLHAHEHPTQGQGTESGLVPTAPTPPDLSMTNRRATPLGPFDPRNRKADNDYGIIARLGWVILVAAAAAIGFGAFAGGARTLDDLVRIAQSPADR